MSEQNASTDERPSLRVAELTIENFRTFGERTVIPFSSGGGEADAIATFHGDNGSGKSNAIAALLFFFRSATLMADMRQNVYVLPGNEATLRAYGIRRRDRPIDAQGPMEIAVRFADERLGALTMRMAPERGNFRFEWDGTVPLERRLSNEYAPWLETPLGAASRSMAILNASRRASWIVEENERNNLPGETIQSALAEDLLEASASRDPMRRARWRAFTESLAAVPAFAGKDVSINRPQKGGDPELTFEERDRSVLGLEELSSGERQLVLLFAGVLLANAAIVAIEEPELSLDAKSQQLFRAFLEDLVQKRRIDQAIIESHVAAFDGPNVIRFHRDPGGPTTVAREPVASVASQELATQAEAQGAKQRWVTADGFTRLPDGMREELHVGGGKHVWFLRGPERWEAWPEEDLDKMLGGGER